MASEALGWLIILQLLSNSTLSTEGSPPPEQPAAALYLFAIQLRLAWRPPQNKDNDIWGNLGDWLIAGKKSGRNDLVAIGRLKSEDFAHLYFYNYKHDF